MAEVDAARAVTGLKELRRLTGTDDGAQRVAWTDTWIAARDWLRGELDGIDGVTVERDEAGNTWATLPGDDAEFVIVGGHWTPCPTAAGSTARSTWSAAWRCFGRWRTSRGRARSSSSTGPTRRARASAAPCSASSACAGTLDPESVRGLTDREGTRCRTRSPPTASSWTACASRARMLEGALAYLELHIEQGPVLEQLDLPLGVVLGTFGVERHAVRFTGAHAHAGATPMDLRKDAFLAAARSALAWRDDAARATTCARPLAPSRSCPGS